MWTGSTYFAHGVYVMYVNRIYLLCSQSVHHVCEQDLLTLLTECTSCMWTGSTYFAHRVYIMYVNRIYLLCSRSVHHVCEQDLLTFPAVCVRHVWAGLAANWQFTAPLFGYWWGDRGDKLAGSLGATSQRSGTTSVPNRRACGVRPTIRQRGSTSNVRHSTWSCSFSC